MVKDAVVQPLLVVAVAVADSSTAAAAAVVLQEPLAVQEMTKVEEAAVPVVLLQRVHF
jgi:hypothetical protein